MYKGSARVFPENMPTAYLYGHALRAFAESPGERAAKRQLASIRKGDTSMSCRSRSRVRAADTPTYSSLEDKQDPGYGRAIIYMWSSAFRRSGMGRKMSCYKQAATGLQEVVLGHGISPSTNTEAMLVTGLSLRRSAYDPERVKTQNDGRGAELYGSRPILEFKEAFQAS